MFKRIPPVLLRCILGFCLLFSASAQAGAQINALEKLRQFLATSSTLRADFSQIVLSNGNQSGDKSAQRSSGSMAFSRPGKFRWEIKQPYPQLLVGDGKTVWNYDPDLRQVTIQKMTSALGSTPAALLAGNGAQSDAAELEKNFTLREIEAREGLTWIEAKPKNPESGFDKLHLGFSGHELRAMELFDHFGQTTLLSFSRIEHNPALDPAQFHFTPPAGIDVIGE